MPGVNPVKLLVNDPFPAPSLVFVDREIVGAVVVLQTIPLAVIVPLLSAVMFPPDCAVVAVIEVTEVLFKVGRLTFSKVLKLFSSPYDVPALFVAYALT